jgi:hypothetical protein
MNLFELVLILLSVINEILECNPSTTKTSLQILIKLQMYHVKT